MAFQRGCDKLPDPTELTGYVLERAPSSLGFYERAGRAATIYARVASDGFTGTSYGVDRLGRVVELSRTRLGLADLVARYRDASRFGPVIPDLVTQYEIYRARDCASSLSYASDLVTYQHGLVASESGDLGDTELYLGALLALSPLRLFTGRGTSRERRVEALMADVSGLGPYLRNDLDRRADS
jgi:hypothetical protein